MLRAFARTWRVRGGAVVLGTVALACCFNPITNHLGYASALVIAVAASVVGAVGAVGIPRAARAQGLSPSGALVAMLAATWGAACVALPSIVIGIASLFTDVCSPSVGLRFLAVLSLPGAVLAALLGVLASAAIVRRGVATTLAVLLLPASIVWSLVRFYRSPTIFAYDPFFGYFPGAVYDETIQLTSTLVTYRLGTLGAVIATAALAVASWDPVARRASWGRWRRSLPAVAVTLAGAAMMLGVYLAGPALGHRESADDIARGLGGRVDGPRCSVVYARTIAGHDARVTRDDCEVRLSQLEDFYGVHLHDRVTVFLFADAEQKQRWMGAADTYIAKPWRHEVYLQFARFPHPVLKHELAHVVAGEMAPGPFHVSTAWGQLPLPGLIEGAAVAAAWEGEGDASPHEWSRAMLEAQMLPPVSVLTGLGFYTHGAGTAYTAAGSFARWLIEAHGREPFHRLYAHGDFASAYGRSLGALEQEWHTFLRTIPVSERLLARARTRFRRAALGARVCPHETAELEDHAMDDLAAGRVETARAELTTVVRRDPTEVRARVGLAESWLRRGDTAHALEVAARAATDLGPAAGTRLRMRVADSMWRWQGSDAARPVYATVDPDFFDEDDARTLEVKRWALGVDGATPEPGMSEAVRDLLIGRGDLDASATAAVARLAAAPHAGALAPMTAYFVGRQLVSSDRFDEAATVFDALDVAQLPTARLRSEAQRLHGVALLFAHRAGEAEALFEALARDTTRTQGIRDTAHDWADRARRLR